MSVQEILEEAFAHPPVNESTTCEWVIVPILHQLGYGRREIVSRFADNQGQFPDYTVLPDTPHAWYLEAKDWKVALQDPHAQQALNYANQNGRRWVVLTNGREWRLYDNQIQGLAASKLVVQCTAEDSARLDAFLRALSRTAVTTSVLDQYAVRTRLADLVSGSLQQADSEIVRAVWNVVRRHTGLSGVSRQEITSCFGLLLGGPREPHSPSKPPAGPKPESESPAPADGHRLDFLASQPQNATPPTGCKPTAVLLPDSSRTEVRDWIDLVTTIVTWLDQRHTLPVPFRSEERGNRYFLNLSPQHVDGRSMVGKTRKLPIGDKEVYLDVHRSAWELLRCLRKLVAEVGENPADVVVILR